MLAFCVYMSRGGGILRHVCLPPSSGSCEAEQSALKVRAVIKGASLCCAAASSSSQTEHCHLLTGVISAPSRPQQLSLGFLSAETLNRLIYRLQFSPNYLLIMSLLVPKKVDHMQVVAGVYKNTTLPFLIVPGL